MAKVRAKSKGYIGLILRVPGEVFEWPDGVKLGSWVEPVGKPRDPLDHDGDGHKGGSLPTPNEGLPADFVLPADWRNLSAAERKSLADLINGKGKVPNAKEADAVIEAWEEANKPEAFGDAPEAQTVQQGIKDAGGGPAPDWVAPGVDAHGNPQPVQADDE